MDKIYLLADNKLTVVLVLVIIILSVALIIVNNRGISLHPIQSLRAALNKDVESYFKDNFITYNGFMKSTDLEMSNFFNEKIFKDFKVEIEGKKYDVGVVERQNENRLMVMLLEEGNPMNTIEIQQLNSNLIAELRFDDLLFQTECDIIGYLYSRDNPEIENYTIYSKHEDRETIYITERNNVDNIYATYRVEPKGGYKTIFSIENGGGKVE